VTDIPHIWTGSLLVEEIEQPADCDDWCPCNVAVPEDAAYAMHWTPGGEAS
jgi:hypothetical protein